MATETLHVPIDGSLGILISPATALLSELAPRVDRYSNGDLAILFASGSGKKQDTYQINLERSYKGVFNPKPELFADYVTGKADVQLGAHKFIIGATVNGGCPAKCLECPFAGGVAAKPIIPGELAFCFKQAKQIAINEGILQVDENFSAGGLLAGELGYSPYAVDLITLMSEFPGCSSCRWSTIAPGSRFNVLEAFQEGAKRVQASNPGHKLSFQFSIHSTDHSARVAHTGGKDLISFEEIAGTSRTLREITGRKPSLAFVLHEGTVLSIEGLRQHFSPDDNVISLRPIYSTSRKPMPPERLIKLHQELTDDGWETVYMPPNRGSNGDVPHELINLVRP